MSQDIANLVARPLAGRAIASGSEATFVIEETVDDGSAPGRLIAPIHRHLHEDEAWYVLEGRLGFRIGDEEVEAGPGDAVVGPHGISHTYWNATSAPARYVLVMGPRTARLLEALHDGTARDRTALEALFRQFGVELLA
jgi:mannose-6-phosphate isomerase-like protein (cupin superfamily)